MTELAAVFRSIASTMDDGVNIFLSSFCDEWHKALLWNLSAHYLSFLCHVRERVDDGYSVDKNVFV